MRSQESRQRRYDARKAASPPAAGLSRALVLVPLLAGAAILLYLVTNGSSTPETNSDHTTSDLNAARSFPDQKAPAKSWQDVDHEQNVWQASPFTSRSRTSAAASPPRADPEPKNTNSPLGTGAEPVAVVDAEQHMVDLETLSLGLEINRQDRAEALVELTRLDLGRGVETLGQLLSLDSSDERQLAVSLLRETWLRYGDDGRIQHLLYQATSDPDEGVAYQARLALEGDKASAADSPY